jgi:glycosyltransferase involved in cell wall biosynthesis
VSTVRQLVIGASGGDAITEMARRLDAVLAGRGRSELYGMHIAPEHVGRFRPMGSMPPARGGDVLVYHASYGQPEVTRFLLERTEPLVLVYHNLTPSSFFLHHDPVVAASLEWGRHELELLRGRVALAVAVSAFNAADLRRYGYEEVHELPVGLDPHRLHAVAPDTNADADLTANFPDGFALWVSQLLPHKRVELILGAHHLVRWVHQVDLALVVVGAARSTAYDRAARRFAQRLQLHRMLFTGRVSEPVLATLYRRATVFVSTSAHEGLALPPLEAMSFGVPVVAPRLAALPDTIGDAGLLLPGDAGAELFAEAMGEVATNPALRRELTGRGLARARQVAATDPASTFGDLLETVVRWRRR